MPYGAKALLLEDRQKSDIKLAIVTNCEAVMQSPESNMASLRELIRLLDSTNIMSMEDIRTILVASLCILFKDILPTYRIRSITEIEKKQKAKKETKKVRFFEENLLVNYRKYTQLLLTILGGKVEKKSPSVTKLSKISWTTGDRIAALKASCQMLETHPRFNYSEDLMKSVLPYLNHNNEKICSIVQTTFKSIFANDLEGNASLCICRCVHAFARKRNYRIRPSIPTTLSYVSIREVLDPKESAALRRDRNSLSRRERKKDKLVKKHEKDMEEINASQSREQRAKLNTLILNEILFVYFKILKTSKDSGLLSSVLVGLSVYSSLIDVAYVEGLLSILGRMITLKSTGLLDGLHCVNTALNILNHPGSSTALETDPTRFYLHLYTLFGRVAGTSSSDDCEDAVPSAFASLSEAYAHSTSPAAIAVSEFLHRSNITSQADELKEECEVASTRASSDRLLLLKEPERLIDIMLTCLNSLIVHRRRDVSVNRVLAFCKRLLGAALAVSDNSCTATMLVRLVHLFRLFPRCEVLFDSETEVGGPYRPDVDNPELCMPASACLWELTLLSKHTSPVVRELANAALHWGRLIHLHGPTEAALKEYKTNFGFGAPTLDQLTQLPPTECRLVLSELDAAFREKPRAMPTEPLTQGRKRKRLFCAPPQWLLYSVESVGLPEDLLPAYYTKKQRLDVQ